MNRLASCACAFVVVVACKGFGPDGELSAGGAASTATSTGARSSTTSAEGPDTSTASTLPPEGSSGSQTESTVSSGTGGGCTPGCMTTFAMAGADCLTDYRSGLDSWGTYEMDADGVLTITPGNGSGLWEGTTDVRLLVTSVADMQPFAAVTRVRPHLADDETMGSEVDLNMAGIVSKRADLPVPDSEGWLKNEAGRVISGNYGLRAAYRPADDVTPGYADDLTPTVTGSALAMDGAIVAICRYSDASLHAFHKIASQAVWEESDLPGTATEPGDLEVGITAVSFGGSPDSQGTFDWFGITACDALPDAQACTATLDLLVMQLDAL